MKKEKNVIFSENLKKAIKSSPYGTYARFAEHMGVDHSTVGRWCIGQTIPHLADIDKIAVALNTSADALFGRTNQQSQSESSRIDDLFRELNALKAQIERPAQNVSSFDPELQALFDRAAAIPRERRKAMMEGIAESIEACEEKLAREAQATNIKKNA